MMPTNYSNKALHPYLLSSLAPLPSSVSLYLFFFLFFFSFPLRCLFSSPPSLTLSLSPPYGNHYRRCRFSPATFLRAFQRSPTLHQPCAPISLFTPFLSLVHPLLFFPLTPSPPPLFFQNILNKCSFKAAFIDFCGHLDDTLFEILTYKDPAIRWYKAGLFGEMGRV